MFEYPRICNWLSFQKISDAEYLVKDHLLEKEYSVGASVLEFAKKLDGKRDPYDVDPSLDRKDVRQILGFLRKRELIRTSHFLVDTFNSFAYTLWIPQWKAVSKTVATIVSFLLFLWLPVLIYGISIFLQNYMVIDTGISSFGIFVGTLSGLLLHELAHGFTAVTCKVPVFEFGVLVRWYILPGAYTLINYDQCSRLKRIQIIAAGVEMNFLLTGVGLILSSVTCSGSFWYSFALTNGLLALVNLTFSDGLDGFRIFIDLLGGDSESFVEDAKKIVKSSAKRQALRKKGTAGHAMILLAYVTIVVQVFIPVLMIINLLGVFGWLN